MDFLGIVMSATNQLIFSVELHDIPPGVCEFNGHHIGVPALIPNKEAGLYYAMNQPLYFSTH